MTKQALPLAIVTRVLSDVLALTPPPPKTSEQKVPVAAARCLQVVAPWVVGDDHAKSVGAIQLPMLHPETKKLLSVRASDWGDEFEKLTGEVMSDAGDYDALLSDAEDEPEDEPMGEAAADSGGGGGVGARVFNPKRKTFKVDTKRLLALNSTLEADAGTVATTKAAVDERLSELRNASLGEAGGFGAAFVLLQHLDPNEPKVLMAHEERIERGALVAKLNPIGGKRDGSETGRATAAREAAEETAGRLSRTAQRELRSGTRMTGAWEPLSRAYVYVHQLANPQDIFLPINVPAGHAGHEQLRGVVWVAVTDLLDPAWRQQHCHSWCHEQLRVAAPLLQGQYGGDVVGAQDTAAREIQDCHCPRRYPRRYPRCFPPRHPRRVRGRVGGGSGSGRAVPVLALLLLLLLPRPWARVPRRPARPQQAACAGGAPRPGAPRAAPRRARRAAAAVRAARRAAGRRLGSRRGRTERAVSRRGEKTKERSVKRR